MRETKFRGRRLDNSEWVSGYLLGPSTVGLFDDTLVMWCCDVDPKTAGEYTGLKDKNGVEIWEGDILRTQSPMQPDSIGEVRFIHGSFYRTVEPGSHPHYPNWMASHIHEPSSDVIGNIYEHPELVEQAA